MRKSVLYCEIVYRMQLLGLMVQRPQTIARSADHSVTRRPYQWKQSVVEDFIEESHHRRIPHLTSRPLCPSFNTEMSPECHCREKYTVCLTQIFGQTFLPTHSSLAQTHSVYTSAKEAGGEEHPKKIMRVFVFFGRRKRIYDYARFQFSQKDGYGQAQRLPPTYGIECRVQALPSAYMACARSPLFWIYLYFVQKLKLAASCPPRQ